MCILYIYILYFIYISYILYIYIILYIYSRLYKYLEINPDLPKSEKIRTASLTNRFCINGEESTWPILDTFPKTTRLYISSGNPGNGKSYIYRIDFPIVSLAKNLCFQGGFPATGRRYVQTLFGFLCSDGTCQIIPETRIPRRNRIPI